MNNASFFKLSCASSGRLFQQKIYIFTRARNSPNPTGFFPRAARPDRLFYFGHMDHTNEDMLKNHDKKL